MHVQAGYWFYIILGSISIILTHIAVIYLFLKIINNRYPDEKEEVVRFVDRFSILLGVIIVVMFEGVFSDFFQYRNWAYGVIRSEAVIEKIEDNWNIKQLEKSMSISKKLNKPIEDYTLNIHSKWRYLKQKTP